MKFKKNNFYFVNIYILVLGIISSYSLPPFNYWYLNFFTFSLLLIFLIKNHDDNLKNFFFYGYFFGFGYFISSLYWIPISLTYDENFKLLIPLAIILIPGFISIFYAFAFLVFKFFLRKQLVFINILIFSLTLGIFEYLRGNILSGFPWNLFVYSFSENTKFIQITSLVGTYAYNTILITIFCSPSILFFNRKKKDLVGFCIILIMVSSIYLYGSFKVNIFTNQKAEILPSNIKVLSTNISIKRFYSYVDGEEILLKLINLSNPNKYEDTIYIWPEGIIPNTNLKSLKDEYQYLFENSFSDKDTIILGVNDNEIKNGKTFFYNSLSVIDNQANTIYKYHKNKLVPFGEFLPLEKTLSKIGLKTLTNNYQSYSSGLDRKSYDFGKKDKIKILPLICYEIIYSGKISKLSNFNIIINISEDGWFGDSIGPYQHFAHSIFRSVEYGKYTLRSANNGISAIVDPSGTVINKLGIKKEGVISINEIKNVDKTPFSTHGNKIYLLIILLYIFLIFSFKKIKNE